MYLIKRSEDDKFVSKPNSNHSYTTSINDAIVYENREDAERNKCGNEYIVPLEDVVTIF